MRHFDSLESVLDYIHDIFSTESMKTICKVNPERLIEWYIAAQYYVSRQLLIYAKELGYLEKIERFETSLVFPKSSNTTWIGHCYCNKGYVIIEITINLLISCNLYRVLCTLIHELSHIEIMRHSECFYRLLYENMQKVGIISESTSFENIFQKSIVQRREGETIYHPIGNFNPYPALPLDLPKGAYISFASNLSKEDIVESITATTLRNRFLKFRNHDVFKYPRYGPFRSLNGKYIDIIKKYAKVYDVDLSELSIEY